MRVYEWRDGKREGFPQLHIPVLLSTFLAVVSPLPLYFISKHLGLSFLDNTDWDRVLSDHLAHWFSWQKKKKKTKPSKTTEKGEANIYFIHAIQYGVQFNVPRLRTTMINRMSYKHREAKRRARPLPPSKGPGAARSAAAQTTGQGTFPTGRTGHVL